MIAIETDRKEAKTVFRFGNGNFRSTPIFVDRNHNYGTIKFIRNSFLIKITGTI